MGIKWTDECEEAFHHLKAALCEVATLHSPKFNKPLYTRTDASRYPIRAVLEQLDAATGDHVPLAFWSRKLERQMQWSPREQETYPIICTLKKDQSRVGTNRAEVFIPNIRWKGGNWGRRVNCVYQMPRPPSVKLVEQMGVPPTHMAVDFDR